MPTFGVTGRVYRKAWRVSAPRPRQWSSCTASASTRALYHWLGNALNGAGTDCGATRSATGSPRATSGFGRASFEFANSARLHSAIGHVPPAGYEAAHYAQTQPQPAAGANT
jgi:hypothetical protein